MSENLDLVLGLHLWAVVILSEPTDTRSSAVPILCSPIGEDGRTKAPPTQ
jgi:hypothetical protein